MAKCDVDGCKQNAVVEILVGQYEGEKRCQKCGQYDVRSEGWW